MRYQLLAREFVVLTDGGQVLRIEDEADRWILISLLWVARDSSRFMAHMALRDGLRMTDVAIRKRVSRLKNRFGLPVQPVYGKGYRLNVADATVDVFELLECVGLAARSPAGSEDRARLYRTARTLWQGGLPPFARLDVPAPELYVKCRDVEQEIRVFGRQILIVDDQIADPLARRLMPYHDCTVAHSFEEYLQTAQDAEIFDLVIVDLHLSLDYTDRRGEDVVKDLNRRAPGVPVFLITMRPPTDVDLSSWGSSLGLARVGYKDGDGASADIPRIADQVNSLLAADPVEQACRLIEHAVVDLRRVAENRIRRRVADSRTALSMLHRMEQKAEQIKDAAQRNDLAAAQRHRTEFIAHFAGEHI